jgi:glycosyltransferase involved in cell wall biosynthesis
MNIWYFHHYATPNEIAGVHRPFDFGKYFEKSENNITVFVSSYLHYAGYNIIKDNQKYVERTYDGIKTIFIKTCGYTESNINRVINMLQYSIRLVNTYRHIIKEGNKPDIIIASSPHPFTLFSGIRIARKLHIPCVCEIRDLWPEVIFYGSRIKDSSLVGKMLLKGERYAYEKASAIVFLKEGDYTYILDRKWDTGSGGKINIDKCYYVNNGVDLASYDKKKELVFEDEDLKNDKFKVIYCGAIRPTNHVDILLDVGKILGDKVQILLFGSGNCVKDIEERIKKENITNVKLKGYVENKYIPYILSKSSVNILNYSGTNYNWSRGNSSNKLFEYLASGKPVVSTVKMGYDILDKYGCGVSAQNCTAEDIAECVKYIWNLTPNDYETMCQNARNAAKDFDIPKLAERYMEYLKEIQQNNH